MKPIHKGYQLIEPSAVSDLADAPEVSVAMLSWLIELLREELHEQLEGVELELIRAEYHGAHAAIGLHYRKPNPIDLGPLVEQAVSRIIRDRSAADFIGYVARAGKDWRALAEELLG